MKSMNSHNLRFVLLKIQDCLSEDDRKRLHFFLANDVPRRIRDDLTFAGTLNLIEILFTQNKIHKHDLTLLINAFEHIGCFSATKILQEYMENVRQDKQNQLVDCLTPMLEQNQDNNKYVEENLNLISLSKYGNNNIQINRHTTNINPPAIVVDKHRSSQLRKQPSSITAMQLLLVFSILLNIGLAIAMAICIVTAIDYNKRIEKLKILTTKFNNRLQILSMLNTKLLCISDLKIFWVDAQSGSVPSDAVIGGQEFDRHVYVARIKVNNGNIIPGKLVDNSKFAETEYLGVLTSSTYQILTYPDLKLKYEWIQPHHFNISLCAIQAGKEKQNDLYIGRTIQSADMIFVGKYDVLNGQLHYVHTGEVKSTKENVEVLCAI
ncbi:hypothetical protein I4U23_004033 [Adineta vaga]|nr:hypothetical protein I4U23_004033 [Adineta vaga]